MFYAAKYQKPATTREKILATVKGGEKRTLEDQEKYLQDNYLQAKNVIFDPKFKIFHKEWKSGNPHVEVEELGDWESVMNDDLDNIAWLLGRRGCQNLFAPTIKVFNHNFTVQVGNSEV